MMVVIYRGCRPGGPIPLQAGTRVTLTGHSLPRLFSPMYLLNSTTILNRFFHCISSDLKYRVVPRNTENGSYICACADFS